MRDPWQFFTPQQLLDAAQLKQDKLSNVTEYWTKLIEQADLTKRFPTTLEMYVGLAGTVAKESASQFYAVREAFWLSDAARWAEYTSRGYSGGPNYHGRGGIQRTHDYNYEALGPQMAELWNADPNHPDFDFVGNPDKILEPDFGAASDVLYFVNKRALPTATWPLGYSLLNACELKDWEWVRKLVYGGRDVDGEQRLEYMYNALSGKTPNAVLKYDPATPPERQVQNWACSIRSATWALKSLGVKVEAAQMQDEMVPGAVSPSIGLLDARGYGLAAAIGKHLPAGTKIEVLENVGWQALEARAGRGPICLGSSNPQMYHWINLAYQIDPLLFRAPNPSPSHQRIGDELDFEEFKRFAGSWSAVFVEAPGMEIEDPKEPPDLQTLVGVAYHEDGVVIPALNAAIKNISWPEVSNVVNFLRTNNPHK